jgi:putative endonuclease
MGMAYAYILRSQKDGKLYYGSTEDLKSRLKAHTAGKVRSTKSRRPLVLVYYEEFATKGEARRRELFFKSITGYTWLREKRIPLLDGIESGELAERLLS